MSADRMNEYRLRNIIRSKDPNALTPDTVDQYLKLIFRSRKSKKNDQFYESLIFLYGIYPLQVGPYIDKLNKKGYWGDYIHLMTHIKEEKDNGLLFKIYNILVEKFNQDIESFYKGEKISTLCKWLPREDSKINKEKNFINTFIEYGANVRDKVHYRKLKSKMTQKIDVLERKMCDNNWGDIDFENVPMKALKKNYKALMTHPECRQNYSLHLYKMNINEPLHNIIKKINILDAEKRSLDINVFEGMIQENPKRYLPATLFDLVSNKTLLVIDTSASLLNSDINEWIIGCIMCFMTVREDAVIYSDQPKIEKFNDEGIKAKINRLMSYCSPPIDQIDLSLIQSEIPYENRLILSNNRVDGINNMDYLVKYNNGELQIVNNGKIVHRRIMNKKVYKEPFWGKMLGFLFWGREYYYPIIFGIFMGLLILTKIFIL